MDRRERARDFGPAYAVPFVEKFPQRARPTHWRPLGARANVALRLLHVLAPFSPRRILDVP